MRGQTQDLQHMKSGGDDLLDVGAIEQEGGGGAGYTQLAGDIPKVQPETTKGAQASASERAYDEDEDENVRELKAKVAALVANRFGGDYRKAFDHYDADKDGGVNKDEIGQLLKDAGVGNRLTRGAWVKGILKKLDKGADGKIQWDEFQAVF